MALRTLVEAINDAMRCEMAADDRVILLGEDIGRDGGVFRVTEGLQAVYGPQRVLDTRWPSQVLRAWPLAWRLLACDQ